MSTSSMALAGQQTKPVTRLFLGLLTWIMVLIFFFPVLWMALTGFKTENRRRYDHTAFPLHADAVGVQVGLEGRRRPERVAAFPRALDHDHDLLDPVRALASRCRPPMRLSIRPVPQVA